ncbi:unnamed protein product [Angiostrongylus costaricensis]|uniref:IstB_IS21 domain-containing protein n=1 Tax=Angiostrongylus costaricensis TaxID=334426 RepID=A0A0R3PTN6_ANGCS|nr:unnamed protein product [Angiostrongylus costaricensis]
MSSTFDSIIVCTNRTQLTESTSKQYLIDERLTLTANENRLDGLDGLDELDALEERQMDRRAGQVGREILRLIYPHRWRLYGAFERA